MAKHLHVHKRRRSRSRDGQFGCGINKWTEEELADPNKKLYYKTVNLEREEGIYKCFTCPYVSPYAANINKHIAAKHRRYVHIKVDRCGAGLNQNHPVRNIPNTINNVGIIRNVNREISDNSTDTRLTSDASSSDSDSDVEMLEALINGVVKKQMDSDDDLPTTPCKYVSGQEPKTGKRRANRVIPIVSTMNIQSAHQMNSDSRAAGVTIEQLKVEWERMKTMEKQVVAKAMAYADFKYKSTIEELKKLLESESEKSKELELSLKKRDEELAQNNIKYKSEIEQMKKQLECECEKSKRLEVNFKCQEDELVNKLSDAEAQRKKCKMGRRIQREEKAKRKRARAEEQRSRDIERMGLVLTSDSSSSDSDSGVEPSKNVEMTDDYVKVNPPINKNETMKGSIDAKDLEFNFKILDSMDVKVNPPINKNETMKGSIDAKDLEFNFKILDSMDVKVNPPINKNETMKGSIDAKDLEFNFKILDSMDVTDESKEFINKIEMNSFVKIDEVKDARKERLNMDASNRNMKSNLRAADVASEYARQLEVESNTNGEFHEEMRKQLECESGRSNELEADFRRREGELVKKLTDAESELKKCKKILDLREKQEKLKLEEELEEEKVRRIQQEAERAIEKSKQAKEERLRKMEMLKNELSVIY